MIKRTLYEALLKWKSGIRRKPLLLQGARQVGKTYLINQFGRTEYADYIYLNFEQTPALKSLFSDDLRPAKIIENISLYLGRKIRAENTLLCFDEIQNAPIALTSLKYFQEQTPEFHIIAAGSLLGVQLGKTSSFPVGKVNFLTLYSLSFSEYLIAIGEELLADEIRQPWQQPISELLHDKLLKQLKTFLFLGGMPEVVQNYIDQQDIVVVRDIQNEIIEAYQRDFSKYTDATQAIRLQEFWTSVPYQLARENKKFKYSEVRKKARATTFEQTIEWLQNAGLIHIAYQLRKPQLPLSGHADLSMFKVYLHDTGLLGAKLGLTPDTIVHPTNLFVEYNGAFIENYVATELIKNYKTQLFYWRSRGQAEVDFVFDLKNKILPVEVKSGSNRSTKSLRAYADKYKASAIFRTSPRNFHQSDIFTNIPLYKIGYSF